ncbi:uncharacterized protein FMAN_06944 [Fusarium mangiferae]|uniref:Uncharacterized protein n=1 Tax=Fusarium mangiferae TaxID=192010 RepID=A0A1L7T6U2_FUSMA|nr:uncharacterized protein FMAN_06944 [Fusarium mangiferae]CVK91853.1 uncharacterized protein FMAN_06944 [Fusarium mangiferae]
MACASNEPQAEPCNFFLLPTSTSSGSPCLVDVVDKIQTRQIHQKAHTLNYLIQRHDLERTLDKTCSIADTSLSTMAGLAADISQALDLILRHGLLHGASSSKANVVSRSRTRSKSLRPKKVLSRP